MTTNRPRLKSSLPKRAAWLDTAEPAHDDGSVPGSLPNPGSEGAGGANLARRRVLSTTTSKRRIQRRVTPLELIQQPLEAAGRKVFDLRKFLLVLAASALVLVLPTPAGLTDQGQRALSLFVFTGTIL